MRTMQTIKHYMIMTAAALSIAVTGVSPQAVAARASQFVPPSEGLHFCYGADDLGRCHLYLGTEASCHDLDPCRSSSSPVGVIANQDFYYREYGDTRLVPVSLGQRLEWCYGLDQFDHCQLYLGTPESCAQVEPCRSE